MRRRSVLKKGDLVIGEWVSVAASAAQQEGRCLSGRKC